MKRETLVGEFVYAFCRTQLPFQPVLQELCTGHKGARSRLGRLSRRSPFPGQLYVGFSRACWPADQNYQQTRVSRQSRKLCKASREALQFYGKTATTRLHPSLSCARACVSVNLKNVLPPDTEKNLARRDLRACALRCRGGQTKLSAGFPRKTSTHIHTHIQSCRIGRTLLSALPASAARSLSRT